jgi:hypothetical protein
MKTLHFPFWLFVLLVLLGCQGDIGPAGINSLIETASEAAGANCPTGGLKVLSGLDLNNNGVLDSNEITSTNYVCSGVTGLNSLIKTSTENPGANCAAGGQKIEMGIDANQSGNLEQAEVQATQFICNGTNGISSHVVTSVVSPGEECENGGIKISVGEDSDNNGILEESEVQSTQFICNGVVGTTTLVKTTSESVGANCSSGGQKIETGLDANKNGTLDQSEVQGTQYVCNGNDGISTYLVTSLLPSGPECENGGVKVSLGPDNNRNGSLDQSEVVSTQVVCNGANGVNSLINTTDETAGLNCSGGGQTIETGLDSNKNGTLDQTEVQATRYICNGTDGTSSYLMISEISDGIECENGGVEVKMGTDSNHNGNLDDSEVVSTQFVCHGIDGVTSLVTTSEADTDCPNGGTRIDVGLDSDGDGILDDGEINSTRFICDGSDAIDQIRFELAGFGGNSTIPWVYSLGGQIIRKFNKSDYALMQSAVLSGSVIVEPEAIGYIELFNLTDNVSIVGSKITVTSTSELWMDSENFISNIPDKEIDLALRIWTSVDGKLVQITGGYLVLRKD